jgi:hypothetical protein
MPLATRAFQGSGFGVHVTTDAAGVAVAPPYTAGAKPGVIGILVSPLPNVAPFFFDNSTVLHALTELHLTEVAAPPLSVPASSSWSIALLSMGISLCGVWLWIAGLNPAGKRP